MRLPDPTVRDVRISLTPLIDVVFLLVVFFMLASTFAQFRTVPLTSREAGVSDARDTPAVLLTLREGSVIALNGRVIALNDLAGRLTENAGEEKLRAIVQVRVGAPAQSLVDVMGVLRQHRRIQSVTVVE